MSEDYDKSIHTNPSGDAWAKFYKHVHPEADTDDMRGWFCNAMMAMHDYLYTTKISSLESDLTAKDAQIKRLREALRIAEWINYRCPCCYQIEPDTSLARTVGYPRSIGHLPGCEIAAALKSDTPET